jgi:hypothetical protein
MSKTMSSFKDSHLSRDLIVIYELENAYLNETPTHNIRAFPTEGESVIHFKYGSISCDHDSAVLHTFLTIAVDFINFHISSTTGIVCFFILHVRNTL